MTRVKSFDVPHKGLRNILSKFSMAAGQTNYSDIQQVEPLKKLGDEMFILLKSHIHTENEHTLKNLEYRAKGASVHDLADHEEIEVIQDKIEATLNAFNGNQDTDEGHRFYLDFTKFHSRYLDHIYGEETVTEKLLQDNFTDEELNAERNKIMGSFDFPVLLLWLKYVIPAETEDARVAMLSGLKITAAEQAFGQVPATIKPEIPETDYLRLLGRLEGVNYSPLGR